MADLTNRSRFRVTVKNREDLTLHFPFNQFAKVEAYVKALKAKRLKPYTEQLDESWLVRIREKGHKPLSATFDTRDAAVGFINRISVFEVDPSLFKSTSAVKAPKALKAPPAGYKGRSR